ncbi:hypothetical protein LJY25_14845 [Hymenobacter sp. BT175]|uniref:hypothetical protein n=1 Tax=Hymenobacter translucens TaxID=2886507 RepID=UPI001D0EE35F|nr:hypothetical protein [Hymenobacter translucens]MCC2547731.1 hypothetical protein [Hymenobacter translucens]
METKLVYCNTSYFCCGVVVREDNTITEAAPILRWSVGKHFRVLRDWLRGKGGSYQVL